MNYLKKPFTGILAFLIVLLTMPLGHVAMILMEKMFGHQYVFWAATAMGFLGVAMLLIGILSRNDTSATFWGLFAGLFVWTGWIEFSYVYYAQRFGVQPLMENGEIVTKPEYLIMPSSIGFWFVFMLYYFFGTKTGCTFFTWFQKKIKVKTVTSIKTNNRNTALTTFNELILILWTFYLVLLFSYDTAFLGDRHPVTYIIAFGSLLWSLILFFKLLKFNSLGYAIRYSIPTVIIFWNFVEVLGRWNVFKEIWTEPLHYKLEITLLTVVFAILTIIAVWSKKSRTSVVKRGELG